MLRGNSSGQALASGSSPTFAGLTLTGNLLFSADATYDIGASGATRPRHLFLSGNIVAGGDVTASGSLSVASGQRLIFTTRSRIFSDSDGQLKFLNAADTGFSTMQFGATGGATSRVDMQKKVTGIADNSATAVFTVTVPNANHAAGVEIFFLSSNGSTDAFESSRIAIGTVVLARTAGVDTVAVANALTNDGIATVGSGATHTLAYGVSAISGASSATQTFTVTVTIDDSGNTGSNQVVAIARLLNAEATGVTIA